MVIRHLASLFRGRGAQTAALFLVALCAIAAYFNAFGGAFVCDDGPGIINNRNVKYLPDLASQARALFAPDNVFIARPVTCLTLSLNYWFGRLDPFGYHLVNLALHVLVCLLIFALARRLLKDNGENDPSPAIPLIAALLFALHPANTEVVTYTYNRSASLMALFFLFSLLSFSRSLEKGRGWYVASLLSFPLAFFSKQTAIVLPVMLLLYDYCFISRGELRALRQRLVLHLPYWLMVAGLFLVSWHFFGKSASYAGVRPLWDLGLFPALSLACDLARYIALLLWPAGLSIDHVIPVLRSLLEPRFIVAVAILAGLAATGAYLHRARTATARLLLYCLLWFFLTLLPSIAYNVPFAERHLYLPAFGFCLILAAAYARLLGTPRRRLVLLLLAAHLAVLGVATHARNCLYARPRLLWEDAAKKYPDSYQAHYVLGNYYLNEDRATDKALEEFRAAYRLRPQFPLLQLGFAKIFIERGEYDGAEEALTRARLLDPDGGMVREGELCYIRGRLAQKRNDPQAALSFFRRSVACDPFIPAARKALAIHYCALGMYAPAEEEFRRAAALDPGDAQAHFYLGLLYSDRGEYRPALEELGLCLRLSPGNAAARRRSDEIRALLKNPAR